VTVVTGVRPLQADYEPFTPIAGYQTAKYDGPAPVTGTYMIAVYTPGEGGPYTLATGTLESFTAPEWIMVPVNQLRIRFWQEQSPLLIFGPYLAVLVTGLGLGFLRPGSRRTGPAAWLGVVAGLLYLGTGAATLLQTVLALQVAPGGAAVVVTLLFAAIALGAGAALVHASFRRTGSPPIRYRVLMVALGIIGLVVWAGVILGPVLAFAAALTPARYG
jgi:hypothetical protein